MRPISFEEREDLCRRADCDLLEFVEKLQKISRKRKMLHSELLAALLRAPRPTDIPLRRVQAIRNKLAEEGKEFTPDEVVETVESMCSKLRNELRRRGVPEDKIPDSDIRLMEIVQ